MIPPLTPDDPPLKPLAVRFVMYKSMCTLLKVRTKRFMAMRRHIPCAILRKNVPPGYDDGEFVEDEPNWHAYVAENLARFPATFDKEADVIKRIIETTNPHIYTKEADKKVLTTLRKKRGMIKAMRNHLRAAATNGGALFMSLNWSIITRFELELMLNAIERRDEDVFPLDEDLQYELLSTPSLTSTHPRGMPGSYEIPQRCSEKTSIVGRTKKEEAISQLSNSDVHRCFT